MDTVWWSRRLATGWMVGSSPRCPDSFSPTKSRNRLSDASPGPDWCTGCASSQGLECFLPSSFFWTLRECPNTIRGLKLIFWNLSTQGNSCWVGCGVIRRRSSPVKKMRKRVHLHFSSFDIGNMVCAGIRCKPNASTFEDVAKVAHMDIDCPIKYWIVERAN
jgi:hypothetical protein